MKYQNLKRSLEFEYKDVRIINLSLSTLDVFSSPPPYDFIEIFQDLNIGHNHGNNILRELKSSVLSRSNKESI